MKIFPPEVPGFLVAGTDFLGKYREDERVEESVFTGEQFVNEDFQSLDVVCCKFVRCSFSGCQMEKTGFRDVIFESCDLSNCNFTNAAFQRVLFRDCKLMGADMIEVAVRYVRFEDCNGEYLNFADSKISDTAFERCKLNHAAFSWCKLNVTFTDCSLQQALLQQTPLKDLDLRTCGLEGIQVTLPDLQGAIVTPLQAADLAVLLGIVIQE